MSTELTTFRPLISPWGVKKLAWVPGVAERFHEVTWREPPYPYSADDDNIIIVSRNRAIGTLAIAGLSAIAASQMESSPGRSLSGLVAVGSALVSIWSFLTASNFAGALAHSINAMAVPYIRRNQDPPESHRFNRQTIAWIGIS
jgi:hypothetical protein